MKQRRLDWVYLIVALLVLWQALYEIAGSDALSAPWQTIVRAAELLLSASFWQHAASTGTAFSYAVAIALLGGLALGLGLGSYRIAGDVADPIMSSLYSIPKITLYPVILLLFGIGLSAKVAFGALHGIFPVAIFAMNGVRNIARIHLKTARVLGLTPWRTATRVLLPAALPEILAGVRIGFSATLLGTLIGELFASTKGLGFVLIRAMEAHDVLDIMALTLVLFVFAGSVNSLLVWVERRVGHVF